MRMKERAERDQATCKSEPDPLSSPLHCLQLSVCAVRASTLPLCRHRTLFLSSPSLLWAGPLFPRLRCSLQAVQLSARDFQFRRRHLHPLNHLTKHVDCTAYDRIHARRQRPRHHVHARATCRSLCCRGAAVWSLAAGCSVLLLHVACSARLQCWALCNRATGGRRQATERGRQSGRVGNIVVVVGQKEQEETTA